MNTLQQRVLKLEAQMNAMAQAWIYLASLVEMEGGMDVMRMEACLRRKRWATAPDINPEARELLRWMCDQLDEGRENRDRTDQEMGKRATSHDLEVFDGRSSAC